MQRIQCFGESLHKLLKTQRFIFGVDMGASKADVRLLLESAGLKGNMLGVDQETCDCCCTDADRLKGNMPGVDSGYYTALGVAASAERGLDIDLGGATVAIEGFGNVGGWAAHFFADAGAKVVAVSTQNGAIYNASGLDIEELLTVRKAVGDDVVRVYQAEKIPTSELLQLPVDILAPCARGWTINSKNVDKITAKVICAGANVPVTFEAIQDLFERGIVFPPDFATNAGGVLGTFMDYLGFNAKEIEYTVKKTISNKVKEILKLATERNVSPMVVGRELAYKKFHETMLRVEEDTKQNRLFELSKSGFRKKIIPRALTKPFVRRYIRRMLEN